MYPRSVESKAVAFYQRLSADCVAHHVINKDNERMISKKWISYKLVKATVMLLYNHMLILVVVEGNLK